MHRVQPFTIGLISLAAFAGCDPVWRVNNPATVEGRLDPACLEAGLRQVSPDLETNRAVDGSRLEFVLVPPATEPYGVNVTWERARPSTIELETRAVGQQANTKAVEGFRSVRTDILGAVERSCGAKVTLGAETCIGCQ